MLREGVHKFMVCGNKNRTHNIQTKQSPFHRGRASICSKSQVEDAPLSYKWTLLRCQVYVLETLYNLILTTALLASDCYRRLYLMWEDTETLQFM